MVDQLCALYADVVAEHAAGAAADPHAALQAESRAAAAFLQGLSPRLHERDLLAGAFQGLLRRPVLGRMLRQAAAGSRRGWIAELFDLFQRRGMDGP